MTQGVIVTGGRRYTGGGHLVRSRLGADRQHLTPPDGETLTSVGIPSGELYAAHTVSGAPSVTAASTLIPAAPAVRAVLPMVTALLAVPSLRRLATTRLARMEFKAALRPRQYTWGHAVVRWPDGTEREGWLRTGEAMDFTAEVAAGAAQRLVRGEGKPGAYTPGTAFGPDLAVEAGATFIVD